MSATQPTIKPYRLKRSGKCPALAFILMAVLAPAGLGLGFWIAGWIARLIHLDFILLTIFLVWMGAVTGALGGSALGGHCRNMAAAFFAMLPATLLGLYLAVLLIGGFNGDDPSLRNAWTVAEALGVAGTPLFVLNLLRKQAYCEKCRKAYGQDKTLWISGDHQPEAVATRLASKAWDPPLAPGMKPDAKRDAITVIADVCPACSDAIVNAMHKTAANKKERLIYSDFWPGEQFKALILKLGEKAT